MRISGTPYRQRSSSSFSDDRIGTVRNCAKRVSFIGSVLLLWTMGDCWLITVLGYPPFKVLLDIGARTGSRWSPRRRPRHIVLQSCIEHRLQPRLRAYWFRVARARSRDATPQEPSS